MASIPTVICGQLGNRRLCAAQVPESLSVAVFRRTSCPTADPNCSCQPTLAVIGGDADRASLEDALRDYGACAEVTSDTVLVGDNMESTLQRQGLYMALSTSTAYGAEPAHLFCRVLSKRLSLSDDQRDGMELALHEAIVNGLLHGNLEISSAGRDTMEGFTEYCRTVDEHLHDPLLGARPLEVFAIWDDAVIEVSVVDCGPGYDPTSLTSSTDPNRKSGRGLLLIREIALQTEVGENGRRMTMRFAR